MNTPMLDAIARALVHGVVEGPPAGDPNRLYVQIVMIDSVALTRKFWSRKTDVEANFTQIGTRNRLTAVGVGHWFPPHYSRDALAFAAVPLDIAIVGADWPKYPHDIKRVCLGDLAMWISEHATPGGGRERWHWNPRKSLFN
jgi:hypothetical protein